MSSNTDEFIRRACDTHADLLAACEKARLALQFVNGERCWCFPDKSCLACQLGEVIARAKGEQS
jgi:hypothetical protein